MDGTEAVRILSRANTGGQMTWPNGLAIDTKSEFENT